MKFLIETIQFIILVLFVFVFTYIGAKLLIYIKVNDIIVVIFGVIFGLFAGCFYAYKKGWY